MDRTQGRLGKHVPQPSAETRLVPPVPGYKFRRGRIGVEFRPKDKPS